MKKLVVFLFLAGVAWLVYGKATRKTIADIPFTPATQAVIDRARSQEKFVLLDFTGSDWCGWCIKLEGEVFHTAEFAAYSSQHASLVKVDFPRGFQLSAAEQAQNEALADRFGIRGFPTIVVLDSRGWEIGRLGYVPGGPQPWLAQLRKITKT